jgi:hypothetical protein
LARLMRAFTLSPENSAAVDRLLVTPLQDPDMQLILKLIYPEQPKSEEPMQLDDGNLAPSDYEYLYSMFWPQPKKPAGAWNFKDNERLLDRATLFRLSQREPNQAAIILELKRRQAANKRRRGKGQRNRPMTVNSSRIVDALLTIALSTLAGAPSKLGSKSEERGTNIKERSVSFDVKGRTRKDAGQGSHKLSDRAGR